MSFPFHSFKGILQLDTCLFLLTFMLPFISLLGVHAAHAELRFECCLHWVCVAPVVCMWYWFVSPNANVIDCVVQRIHILNSRLAFRTHCWMKKRKIKESHFNEPKSIISSTRPQFSLSSSRVDRLEPIPEFTGWENVSPSWSTHMRTVKFPRRGPCSNMKWRITLLNTKLCKAAVSREVVKACSRLLILLIFSSSYVCSRNVPKLGDTCITVLATRLKILLWHV